jgi:cell migration-inducing and hyaluronan-binding protein
MFRLILVRHRSLLAAAKRKFRALLLLAAFALAPTIAAAQPAQSSSVSCNGVLPVQALRKGGGSTSGQQPNLVISSPCVVNRPGNYFYGNVNIIAGGTLTFSEPLGTGTLVNFWASNIIVENGGALVAGASGTPYGSRGGVLDIYLYGPNQSGTTDPYTKPGQGALCMSATSSTVGPCGIPLSIWSDNGNTFQQSLPGGVSDYFYQYGPDYGDNLCSDGKTQWNPTNGCGTGTPPNPPPQVGYFGYKFPHEPHKTPGAA